MEKLALLAFSDVSAAGRSAPTSTQVPLDTTTLPDPGTPGTATKAEAVSWLPTVCTPTPRQEPTARPAGTIGGSRAGSRPTASSSSADQAPVRASRSAVVEALDRSVPSNPVSIRTTRSGRSSSLAARLSSDRSCAASWKIVLRGSSWMPVTA